MSIKNLKNEDINLEHNDVDIFLEYPVEKITILMKFQEKIVNLIFYPFVEVKYYKIANNKTGETKCQ